MADFLQSPSDERSMTHLGVWIMIAILAMGRAVTFD